MNELSAKEVSQNLLDACDELEKESESIAKLIVAEAGKPYKQAIVELQRSVESLQFAAEEAKRIYGESVPIDATGSTDARFMAFTSSTSHPRTSTSIASTRSSWTSRTTLRPTRRRLTS